MVVANFGLVFFGVLVFASVILAVWVQYSKWAQIILTENGIVLLFGCFVGGILYVFDHWFGSSWVSFEPNDFTKVFYNGLLPLIIFSSGFSMKKKNFFANIGSILLCGILGTFICAITIGLLIWGFGTQGWVSVSTNFIESLMFGSLLSATDPLATLALFRKLHVEPQLYCLVLGESTLNGVVSNVIFKTLTSFSGLNFEISFTSIALVLLYMLMISAGSLLIGLAIALLSAALLLYLRKLSISPTFEFCFVVIAAFLSYVISESIDLCGILSIFICAILMAHYHWYNVSVQTRIALFTVSNAINHVAETSTFLSVGLVLFCFSETMISSYWPTTFIIFSVFVSFACRAMNIFPLSAILNLRRKNRIPFSQQVVMWFGGLKGAISIILALNTGTQNILIINNTTYVIVLITNLFCGPAIKPLIYALKIKTEEVDPNSSIPTDSSMESFDQEKHIGKFMRWWSKIDEEFFKRVFGGKPKHINNDREIPLENLDDSNDNNSSYSAATDTSSETRSMNSDEEEELYNTITSKRVILNSAEPSIKPTREQALQLSGISLDDFL